VPNLPRVAGDAAALRSAVQNLLANAVKYGGADRWVGIRAEKSSRRPPEVRITIEDHGPGIPGHELPHIFEPFYRGGDAVARQVRGNGLGLPADVARFGDIAVDFRRAEVTKGGTMLELSAREFKLLCYFVEHRGAALSRDELLNEVWGYNATPSTRTVDVHVAWLRQKPEDDPHLPQYILTVHGLGNKFVG